jgi:hypothetical protein
MSERLRLAEQITHILWEVKAGKSAADVCRTHGVSADALQSWQACYGGLGSGDIAVRWEQEEARSKKAHGRDAGRGRE